MRILTSKKILKQSDSAKEIEVRWQKKNAQLRLLRGFILGLTKASALALGFYYVIHGEMLLGSLIVVWSYVTQSLDPITGIARQIDQMQKDLVGISLSFSYLDTKSSVQDANPSKKLKVNKGQISFDNVSFRYKDRNVIKGLNLEVPAGKVVAIVGKSGSGKSTLVKLLLRFYDPQGGKITIDGKDIKNYTQKSLRKCISTVMQDSVLFNDTISNNISYAVGKASNADLIKASKASSSYGFINNLPNKFSSIVGERGVRLSGGEQQRINIARAVLRNSPIIVFDEATSSLDSESEQMIQEAMWKIIEGKTTIIIAHRLSTVMKADIIVVMDKGKVTEQGTHQDLVAKKGIYSKLFEIQSGGYLDTIDSELVEVDAK